MQLSVHVAAMVCSLATGTCTEHARFGPYYVQSQGPVSPALCRIIGLTGIAKSPAEIKWFQEVDRTTSSVDWKCDAVLVADL